MSQQHKLSVMAFFVLVVLAIAIIGLQLRADAAGSDGVGAPGQSSVRSAPAAQSGD